MQRNIGDDEAVKFIGNSKWSADGYKEPVKESLPINIEKKWAISSEDYK